MRKERFVRKLSDRPIVPFDNVEEAWLWYSRCQMARLRGERFTADVGMARPCEPDDVYRIVDHLYRLKLLAKHHLYVLAEYGLLLCTPHAHLEQESKKFNLWEEAMTLLTPIFKKKGIITS